MTNLTALQLALWQQQIEQLAELARDLNARLDALLEEVGDE